MLAVELRPPDLDVLGLGAALREHFRRAMDELPLKIHFTDATQSTAIAPEIQTILFRTAQECLNNVARHAHARHVRVHLSILRKTILMSISDNGIGFDPDQLPGKPGAHMGLRAIHEMVASLGGSVAVESAARNGTKVRVAIPQQGAPP
jgi:signal transduction histidine kinase